MHSSSPYKIKVKWYDYSDVRRIVSEQNRLGASLSITEGGGILSRIFTISGTPANIAVFERSYCEEQDALRTW